MREFTTTPLLESYLARATQLVPSLEHGTSYGMPALRYRGRPLISVVATKSGYSVFPFSPAVVETVLTDLEEFDATKGGIRFTEVRPLPIAAFDRLVQERVAEIDAALGTSGGRGR